MRDFARQTLRDAARTLRTERTLKPAELLNDSTGLTYTNVLCRLVCMMTETTSTPYPLPTTVGGYGIAYDLNDGDTLVVELQRDGTFYGAAAKFDTCAATAVEMIAKLKSFGATFAGIEKLS